MNNRKIMTVAIILVAVIALSIGFAAYSSTLNIESQANVNPNSDDFSVKFSKVEGTLDESNVIATSIIGEDVEAKEGVIDNSNNPTITNLNASFTKPGESVTYEFYVMNTGEYNAYLRDVEFKTTNDKFISCTAGSGATPSLVEQACEGITFELTIGGQAYTKDGTFVVQELAKGASKKVTVKISYASGSTLADGSFTVNIGDVALTYASTSAGEYPQPEDTEEVCEVVNVKSFGNSCTYQDLDSTSTITKGDKVTCGTESFYVIEDLGENTNVKMLAEWNLNVSDGIISEDIGGIPYSYTYCESTEGYQDSHVRGYLDYESDETLVENLKYLTFESDGETAEAYIGYGSVPFDSTYDDPDYGYWTTGDNHGLNTSIYTACTGDYCLSSYPAYVYDDNATIKSFVDDYTLLLNTNISGASATGRLITYEELVNLGCSGSSCTSAPSWVYQTSYWTASAKDDIRVWKVYSYGDFSGDDFDDYHDFGVRPVIEISRSVIQPS